MKGIRPRSPADRNVFPVLSQTKGKLRPLSTQPPNGGRSYRGPEQLFQTTRSSGARKRDLRLELRGLAARRGKGLDAADGLVERERGDTGLMPAVNLEINIGLTVRILQITENYDASQITPGRYSA